jgi:zinc transporter, ZIP family
MLSFIETVLFSAVMGLSIYLSVPLLLNKGTGEAKMKLLVAVAIGILVFLIGDVFLNAAGSLYNGSLYGYGSSPVYDAIFTLSMIAGFMVLFYAGDRRRLSMTPTYLALIIAVGIGFQNLTEGLLFGSLGVTIGLSGAALVVLVGFIFQNMTEGFPIASPLLASAEGKTGVMLGALLIGGSPTILGGAIGYYYNSPAFDLLFYGLAIGTMFYVILPMLRNLFRESEATKPNAAYMGLFLGFLLGFVVNLV